jgi:adenosylhomocysteinase (EC 3.3.1.1)
VVYIVQNRGQMTPKVFDVPREIDERVAELKLESMGIEKEELTQQQREYMRQWRYGT